METLRMLFEGDSPILMHNPAGSMGKSAEGISRKTIPSPEDEAKASRYVIDNKMYVPAPAVRNCILNGSKGYRIGKKSAMTILSGALLMLGEYFLFTREGTPISGDDYSIDVRRAVIQRQGIIRARARIELPWECEAVFGYNEELASVEDIKLAAVVAGQTIGLLDYRVEKKGWFGRFSVREINIIE